MRRRLHAVVSGRVQGVFFRARAQEKAQELGLAGWVRNLPDGRVEVVAEGEERAVASLLDWLSIGPPASRVDGVTAEWMVPQGEDGFHIRR